MADAYAGLGTPVQAATADPYVGLGTPVAQPAGSITVSRAPDGSLRGGDGTVYSQQGVGPQGERHAVIDGSAPVTVAGVVGQGVRGLGEGAIGSANSAMKTALPDIPGMLGHFADATDYLGGMMKTAMGNGVAPPQVPTLSAMSAGTIDNNAANAQPMLSQQPQNSAERWARTLGNMAPAAFGPEAAQGIIPQLMSRAASVIAPTVGSMAGRGIASAVGIDPNIGANVGMIAGGIGGRLGMKPGGPPPELPGGIGADASTRDINRAVNYVMPRLKNPDPTMLAADAAGKPVTLGQIGGEPGITAVRTLARRPGQTSGALNAYAGSSREPDPTAQGIIGTSPQRVLDHVGNLTGISPEAANGDMSALSDSLRQNGVSPAYDAALANPVNRTHALASVLQEPDVQKALAFAQRKVGTTATEHGPIIDPDTGAQAMDPNTKEPLYGAQPNAVTLDLTKKYLGQMVERDQITNKPIKGGEQGIGNDFILDNLKRLTTALAGDQNTPAAIPGYRNALDQAGDVLSMEQNYRNGQQHLFNSAVPADQFQGMVSGLGPADTKAFQAGGANAMFNLAQKNLLNGGKFTPQVQAKLQSLYGPDVTQQMLTGLSQEKALTGSLNRMRPANQSATSSDLPEMAAQDSASPILQHGGEFILNSALAGPHVAIAKLGLNIAKPAMQGLLGKIGQMPEGARDVAGGLLLSPSIRPTDLAGYLAAAKAARGQIGFRPGGGGILPLAPPQQSPQPQR